MISNNEDNDVVWEVVVFLTLWHGMMQILCCQMLGSVPKWYSIYVGQLWPFFYRLVEVSPYDFCVRVSVTN